MKIADEEFSTIQKYLKNYYSDYQLTSIKRGRYQFINKLWQSYL